MFKYSELKEFLEYANRQYLITTLGSWDGSNAIILRHDIDLDIRAAYNLFQIEKDIGLHSSFFVLMGSTTYNPLSTENRILLKEISTNGFEIGVHFDPSAYNIDDSGLKDKLDIEANILSDIIGENVLSVSLHNPSIRGNYPLFEGYYNAYDPQIFGKDRYLSDSLMKFPEDIYEFSEKALSIPIQILLHPMHYTMEGFGYPGIFSRFLQDFCRNIDNIFKVNPTFNASIKRGTFSFISKQFKADYKL